jgi:NADH:ubiquinone reductase (H+-translocating)
MTTAETASRPSPHVVVIGAGFGGLACVRAFRDSNVDVTLIDRHNFHTFQPLLYQVATAGLNAADVAYPVRGILRRSQRAKFKLGMVTAVDTAAKNHAR